MKKSKSNKQLMKILLVACSLLFTASTGFSQMMQPSDGSKVTMSKYSFSETVDILQGAIEGQNLMVIHVIDGQKMLRMAGKQVDLFGPDNQSAMKN
jgi:hypothetical protein